MPIKTISGTAITGAIGIGSTVASIPASGTKNGYVYTVSGVSGTPAGTYNAIASPSVPNQTGTRYFCSFADAVVRSSVTAINTCDSSITPLQ